MKLDFDIVRKLLLEIEEKTTLSIQLMSQVAAAYIKNQLGL